MKRQIQEIQVKQEESERKITALEKDNIKLNSTMKRQIQEFQVKQEESEKKTALEKDNIKLNSTMKRQIQEIQVKQEESERKITALEKDNIKLNSTMKRQIQEFQVKQEEAERKITALEKDNIKLNSTMKRQIQEIQVKQEESERKIMALEKDNIKLNSTLWSLSKKAKAELSDVNTFVREFYKNFTVSYTLTDKHSSTIQSLYNFTDAIRETLMNVKDKQKEMLVSINKRFDATQGCQAGYDVGGDAYPAHAFPSARTVQFNPPFKIVPALSFGTTMLDSTSHLSLRLELLSLTPESFTVHFHTWGKYALFAAKFSWMACPK